MADNIFSKQNGDFTRVLPPVISGTPQRSLDADSVLARANAMLAQTKAQGSTPFAGSSYERALPPPTYQNAPIPQTSVAQVAPTPPPQTEPTTTNPYDAFNLLLQESLKKAQTLNPTDLLKQQRELQRQRIAKISGTAGASGQSITPEEARFLSPAQQESVRNSGMAANSTAIDEVQYQIQKVNQDKKDLLEQIMFAKDSGDKMRTAALEAEYKKKDEEFKNAQLAETIRNNKADQTYKNATLAEQKRGNLASKSIARTKAGVTPESKSNTLNQLDLVETALTAADKYKHASGRGRTIWESGRQKIIGSTDYTNLDAQANTIKTNLLMLSTDPSVKKFFGPQMSNADVKNMMAAATTMNPEDQSPEEIKKAIDQGYALIKRIRTSVENGVEPTVNTPATSGQVMHNGVLYNVDANGDMTPVQ